MTMSARQLRDLLGTLPDDALDRPVILEGCDCEAPTIGLSLDEEIAVVVVRREGGSYEYSRLDLLSPDQGRQSASVEGGPKQGEDPA
jgi:hypothetical protein